MFGTTSFFHFALLAYGGAESCYESFELLFVNMPDAGQHHMNLHICMKALSPTGTLQSTDRCPKPLPQGHIATGNQQIVQIADSVESQ